MTWCQILIGDTPVKYFAMFYCGNDGAYIQVQEFFIRCKLPGNIVKKGKLKGGVEIQSFNLSLFFQLDLSFTEKVNSLDNGTFCSPLWQCWAKWNLVTVLNRDGAGQ